MDVDYDESVCSILDIENAVQKAGYKATLFEKNQVEKKEKVATQKDYALLKLIICGVLLLILMYFSMGNMMWDFPSFAFLDHHQNPMGIALLQFLLV